MKSRRIVLLAVLSFCAFLRVEMLGMTFDSHTVGLFDVLFRTAADLALAFMAWDACKEHHGLPEKAKPKKGDGE